MKYSTFLAKQGIGFSGQGVNEAGSSENSDGMTLGLSLLWKTYL